MGRQRSQPQEPQQTSPEGQIAVLLLSGGTVAGIAPPLLFAMPPGLLTAPVLAAEVAEEAARFVLSTPLDIPTELPEAGIMREAALNAVVYRAAYALAATRRVARGVLEVEAGGDRSEAIRAALVRERRFLEAHRDVTGRRMSAARATEGMMELHGPVLVWRHGATRVPTDPRPAHKAADGRAFDLRRGIPASTGVLPGVLPGCTCAWDALTQGARMLI